MLSSRSRDTTGLQLGTQHPRTRASCAEGCKWGGACRTPSYSSSIARSELRNPQNPDGSSWERCRRGVLQRPDLRKGAKLAQGRKKRNRNQKSCGLAIVLRFGAPLEKKSVRADAKAQQQLRRSDRRAAGVQDIQANSHSFNTEGVKGSQTLRFAPGEVGSLHTMSFPNQE